MRGTATKEDGDLSQGFLDENCWWSGCQQKNWSDRGCPNNTILTHSDDCPGGNLFQCCLIGTSLNKDE